MVTLNVDTDGGATYDYLSEAEAALPATLTEPYVIECEGVTVDIGDTTILGCATTAANNLEISGGVVSISGDCYTREANIFIRTDNTYINNIRFNSDNDSYCLLYKGYPDSTFIADSLVFAGSPGPCYLYDATTLIFRNCIAVDMTGYYYSSTGTIELENCTYYATDGNRFARDIKCTNCVGVGSTDYSMYYGSCTGDYNISSDTTAPGDHSITNAVATDLFTNPSEGDFTLKSGSDAIEAGTDLSTEFTTDITGATRTTPWDIGAFMYATVATGWAHKIFGITPTKVYGVEPTKVMGV